MMQVFEAARHRMRQTGLALVLGIASVALSGCYYPPPYYGGGYAGQGYRGGYGQSHGGYSEHHERHHDQEY